jgi:two-component system, NtrC family, response regulator AtoC
MNALIVDDEENIRESLKRFLELDTIDADTAVDGVAAQGLLKDKPYDVVIVDLKMPRMNGLELIEWIRAEGFRFPVIMISAHGEISDAVAAMKAGADDYLEKPFDPAELVRKATLLTANRKRDDLLEAGSRTAKDGLRLVGESRALKELRVLIGKVAASDTTILLTGESGSGKEVIAREIHNLSPRSGEPFVAVNIGGIHEHLVESELFGHEKGSFTGADSRQIGLFELAGSGTLFLDEIGEMPLNLQVKLLRVIQERKIRRLGGTRDIPVSARIVSATNRDIEGQVAKGSFREDLYYRLNVMRIAVPPLRERMDDVPLLAGFLLERLALRMGRKPSGLSPEALSALMEYRFPGNIRELENVLERALIYSGERDILPADLGLPGVLPAAASRQNAASPAQEGKALGIEPESEGDASASLDDIERRAIIRALDAHAGNRTKAAQELGISRRTILNKIKAYGLA